MRRVTPPPGAPTVTDLAVARRRAHTERARWLTAIHRRDVTIVDTVNYATTPDGRPLRKIKLRELLASQPRCSETRAERLLGVLRDRLYLTPTFDLRLMTIGWLLDNRTRGRRFDCFLDVLGPEDPDSTDAAAELLGARTRPQPWAGFPYTARAE
jgi:hypothetical protein